MAVTMPLQQRFNTRTERSIPPKSHRFQSFLLLFQPSNFAEYREGYALKSNKLNLPYSNESYYYFPTKIMTKNLALSTKLLSTAKQSW